jgi:hypothetical protein
MDQWIESTHIRESLLLKFGETQTWFKRKWKRLLETNKTCGK